MCWYGKTLTLDEYKAEFEVIKKEVLNDLEQGCKDDEVFELISEYRDNNDLICQGVYNGIFKSFDSAKEFMATAFGDDEEYEETYKNRFYWSFYKYKLFDGEYKEILYCALSLDAKILFIRGGAFGHKSFYYDFFKENFSEHGNWSYLTYNARCVRHYFKCGDLLRFNCNPFGKPFYAVFGGESEKGLGEKCEKENFHNYEHLCSYYSVDENGLRIGDISSNCFHDCVAFWNPAILYAEKVEICPDESLNLLSEKLKQDESLWYKFVNFNCNKRIEDFLYN